MKESNEELYLHDLIDWLRDHSHEVAYWRLVYMLVRINLTVAHISIHPHKYSANYTSLSTLTFGTLPNIYTTTSIFML